MLKQSQHAEGDAVHASMSAEVQPISDTVAIRSRAKRVQADANSKKRAASSPVAAAAAPVAATCQTMISQSIVRHV